MPNGAQLALQAVLGIRFVLGAVFVGLTRPDFTPFCVARSSVLPIAVVVIALDGVITAGLAWRAMSMGALGKGQKKPLILIILAFALWTGVSFISQANWSLY